MKNQSTITENFAARRLTTVLFIGSLILVLPALLLAEEVDLKALKSLDAESKSNQTPYAGVYGGTTMSQSADVKIDGNKQDLDETTGSAVIGLVVGNRWRLEKVPLELGLGFEAMFLSTELNGELPGAPAAPPFAGTDVAGFQTDMNAAVFLLNGTLALDARRYRPYTGTFLSSFKPFVGAGVGGSQLWFRDTTLDTVTPGSTPTSTAFSMDSFVFAWQAYAGLEYAFNDKVAIYGDYRQLNLANIDDEVSDYENTLWTAGVRILFDKDEDR